MSSYEQKDLPQCWQDYFTAINAGIDRVILYGAPGTGKTYAGLTYGVGEGGSFRLTCSEEMTVSQVSGMWRPHRGEFLFQKGEALNAWLGNGQVGGRVVVDEVDKASGDVLGELLNFLDSTASSSFRDPDTGEVYRPKAGFSAVMTSNIEHPDELPVALRDRFPVAIKIDTPHPQALEVLPPRLRSVAVGLVTAEGNRRASLRAFYAFNQMLSNGVDNDTASRLAFGEKRAKAIAEALAIAE